MAADVTAAVWISSALLDPAMYACDYSLAQSSRHLLRLPNLRFYHTVASPVQRLAEHTCATANTHQISLIQEKKKNLSPIEQPTLFFLFPAP